MPDSNARLKELYDAWAAKSKHPLFGVKSYDEWLKGEHGRAATAMLGGKSYDDFLRSEYASSGAHDYLGRKPSFEDWSKGWAESKKLKGYWDQVSDIGGAAPIPGAAPDLADSLIRKAQESAMLALQTSGSRKASFVTGPDGDVSALPTKPKTMLDLPVKKSRRTLLGGAE